MEHQQSIMPLAKENQNKHMGIYDNSIIVVNDDICDLPFDSNLVKDGRVNIKEFVQKGGGATR